MKRAAVVLTLLLLACFLTWEFLYPGEDDPKNLHYLGWKAGLLPMEPKQALSTMTHDDAFPLVVGKNRSQLERRFKQVFEKGEVRPYLADYCASSRSGRDVLFLNRSDWMVVMEHGRVAELILCKG